MPRSKVSNRVVSLFDDQPGAMVDVLIVFKQAGPDLSHAMGLGSKPPARSPISTPADIEAGAGTLLNKCGVADGHWLASASSYATAINQDQLKRLEASDLVEEIVENSKLR